MVALPDSGDTAVWATRGLTLPSIPSGRLPMPAARAKAVIEGWHEQLSASRDMLWSPTIRAALIAGTPWLDVFCPNCVVPRIGAHPPHRARKGSADPSFWRSASLK
jgi:hypothetical protein